MEIKLFEVFKDENLTPEEIEFLNKPIILNQISFKELIRIFKQLEDILVKYNMEMLIFDDGFITYKMIETVNKIWIEYDMDKNKVEYLLDVIKDNIFRIKNMKREESIKNKIKYMLEEIANETEDVETDAQLNVIDKFLSEEMIKRSKEMEDLINKLYNENNENNENNEKITENNNKEKNDQKVENTES